MTFSALRILPAKLSENCKRDSRNVFTPRLLKTGHSIENHMEPIAKFLESSLKD
jgi:hypothetical protein